MAITELLLNSLANPDVRAAEDDSFLNRLLEEEWSKDKISEDSRCRSGGRTPLHIASARDDNYWVKLVFIIHKNKFQKRLYRTWKLKILLVDVLLSLLFTDPTRAVRICRMHGR